MKYKPYRIKVPLLIHKLSTRQIIIKAKDELDVEWVGNELRIRNSKP